MGTIRGGDAVYDYDLIDRLWNAAHPPVPGDAEHLRSARNAVAYGGKSNPVIEWTISDEWYRVPAGRSQAACSGEIKVA